MKRSIFYLVDVFADRKYAGNQLAVFLPGRKFSNKEMQSIAREMNYSETTFILSARPRKGGYPVRIFTPGEEVPFAGHPTLGTAFIIREKIEQSHSLQINLNLKVGQIPVTFEPISKKRNRLWMKRIEPRFLNTLPVSTLTEILHLTADDIDNRFPIEEVSTGLPFIIVPMKSLEAIVSCRINQAKYFELIKKIESKAILVFSRQVVEPAHHLHARVFVDYYGIPEDPATGSANGCLAGYLIKHRYFGTTEIDIQVEQGYEINRPSVLYLRGKIENGTIQVWVGGEVVLVGKGEWY